MATPNVFTDCRFCLEKKRHVLPINEEMSNVYFSVTQMKVNKQKKQQIWVKFDAISM